MDNENTVALMEQDPSPEHCPTPTIKREDAATLIERGPNLPHCMSMAHEDTLKAHLICESTFEGMWKCMAPLLDNPDSLVIHKREICSAYLMICFPAVAFSAVSFPLLAAAALTMITQFEDIVQKVYTTPLDDAVEPPDNATLTTFRQSVQDFLTHFAPWRVAMGANYVACIESVFYYTLQTIRLLPATHEHIPMLHQQVENLLTKHEYAVTDPARTAALRASVPVFGAPQTQ
jgi:hypothetical protein